MNPQQQFCPYLHCSDYGKIGAGNITIHSQKEQRYQCQTCKGTFTATHDTPLYRLRHDYQLLAWVISLLAYGCPKQAIVATFALDPRTVDDWWQSSGQHSQHLHEATVLDNPRTCNKCRWTSYATKCKGPLSGLRWPWLCPPVCG